MNFGNIVKARMAAIKITAAELSRQTGYSPQFICDLLGGRRRWNETSMDKVCKVLGIQIRFEFDDSATRKVV